MVRPTGSVPQLEILKRTSVFLMHGAGGAAREAGWFSVPMVAYPQTFEQHIISERIVQLGAGQMLRPRDLTPKTIRKKLLQVMENPKYRQNSQLLGDACRKAGGVQKAVEEIGKIKRNH